MENPADMSDSINYNELITSYLTGNISSGEKVLLADWVNQSPENARIFEEAKLTWVATTAISDSKKFNTLHAYNSVISHKSKKNNSFTFNRMLKIAAVFVFMAIIGGIITFYITRSFYTNGKSGLCYFEAPIGSRAIATLPDGTKVWLNAGSRIEYSTDYDKITREIKLTGEGYFKVAHNPEKPFLVKTNTITVKALGTSFNVKAYPDEKQVTTTLVEGKVELKGKGLNNQTFSYLMKPKQKVSYINDDKLFITIRSNQKAKKVVESEASRNINAKEELPLLAKAPLVSNSDVKTELYTSWKDERWIIESENLGDLSVLFERRYNVSIAFLNDEIKSYRFSATIQNETIEQIFEIMRLTLPVSFTAEKGRITLRTDKNLKKIYKAAYQQN